MSTAGVSVPRLTAGSLRRLLTFLRKHVLAAMGCCFAVSVLLMKLSLVLNYLLNTARLGRQSSWFWHVELVGIRVLHNSCPPPVRRELSEGPLQSGAVMFSDGAVLRKVSP